MEEKLISGWKSYEPHLTVTIPKETAERLRASVKVHRHDFTVDEVASLAANEMLDKLADH